MKKNRESDRPVPVRLTLAEQAADCIRQGLKADRWDGLLPSESELCREFGVSRGTLRSGLAVLFSEGLLSPGGRGGRHTIVATVTRRKSRTSALKGTMVRVLSPQPRFIIAGQTQSIFQTISEVLGRAGLHLEFEHHPGLWNLKHPDSALRKITRQPNVAGWLLYRSTHAVQKWFAGSGIPAVVLGGKFPDVALSHGEFDLVAASRHAAGIFASRGHRRMVFITVEKSTAGDLASAEAFQAAAAAAGAHAEIAVFDDTVADLCRVLDGLLISKPYPTAFLVGFPNHVHATLGHLTRRGFPVPKVAAVISRMDAMLLAESIPAVARYSMSSELLGRGLARLIMKAVTPGSKAGGHCIIMPEFIDGETAGGKTMV
jgi:DNA-binding LacI/PurR family transcriptional regulator